MNSLSSEAVPDFDRVVETGAGYESGIWREFDIVDNTLVAGHTGTEGSFGGFWGPKGEGVVV